MVKRICVSTDDWFYDAHLSQIRGNKSAFARKLMYLGSQSLLSDISEKSRLLQYIQEIENLKEENKRLKFELGKVKKPKYSARVKEAMKEVQSIMDADLHTR